MGRIENCFACSQPIPVEYSIEKQRCSLKKLCLLLKLPVSIAMEALVNFDCETSQIENVDSIGCCHSCLSIINQAQDSYNQIQVFESNLTTLREKIKEIICENFEGGRAVYSKGECNPGQIIKKSFVQCWKGWHIPLVRIDDSVIKTIRTNTSKNKKVAPVNANVLVTSDEKLSEDRSDYEKDRIKSHGNTIGASEGVQPGANTEIDTVCKGEIIVGVESDKNNPINVNNLSKQVWAKHSVVPKVSSETLPEIKKLFSERKSKRIAKRRFRHTNMSLCCDNGQRDEPRKNIEVGLNSNESETRTHAKGTEELISVKMKHLRNHQHNRKKKFILPSKTKSLAKIVELTEQKQSLEVKIRCTQCNKQFKDVVSRDVHVKRAHEGDMKPYECQVCRWKFASPSKLMAHIHARQHNHQQRDSLEDDSAASINLPCPKCSQVFKDTPSLDGHIRGKHEGVSRPYYCSVCPKTYKKKNHLEDHIKTHDCNERPFICVWCEENTSTAVPSEENDTNASAAFDKKSRSCFSTEKKLNLHILAKHHNNSCKECGKSFMSPYVLERHLATHDAERSPPNFICEICGAKYSALKRLKVHQLRHENIEEPYKCEDCGKFFSEPRTLKHHRDSIHENTFKYHCEICGIGCQQIYMLRRHMLCHTVEKNFECSTCNLKFKRKQQLLIHERKHMGDKPFKCQQCGKGFIEKKKLKNHEFVHKGVKPHQCTLCSKTFALKHYLKHHMNMSHKELNEEMDSSTNIDLSTDIVIASTDGCESTNLPQAEQPELQPLFHTDGELVLEALTAPKYVSVEFIHESQVVQEEVVAYATPDDSELHRLDNAELVVGVGEWISFGFVQTV